tara:strand:- start:26547 stop:26909 length:363 start_codon:yes stop_codon:yes gene_type:complete
VYPKTIDEIRKYQDHPVVMVSEDGVISYANEAFGSVFEWNCDEVIGETLDVVIPEEFRTAHNAGFSRFLATGKPHNVLNKALVLKARKRSGEVFNAEHFILAEKKSDKWIIAAVMRPLDN